MPREQYFVDPRRDDPTLAQLTDEINRALESITQRFSQVSGDDGQFPEFRNDISLRSNRVREVAWPEADDDVVTLGYLKEFGIVRALGEDVYTINNPISYQGSAGYPQLPNLEQILKELRSQLGSFTIDRLTTQDVSPSTMILSDDDTDQTLTGDLGWLNFSLAGRDPGSGFTEKRIYLDEAATLDVFFGNPASVEIVPAFFLPFPSFQVKEPVGGDGVALGMLDLSSLVMVPFYVNALTMVNSGGAASGGSVIQVTKAGTTQVLIADEDGVTGLIGTKTQLLLASNAGQWLDFAGVNNIVLGGAAQNLNSTLDGPGTGAESMGVSVNAYAVPVTGADDDYTGIGMLAQAQNSALDIATFVGGRYYSRLASTYSGDVTRMTAGQFVPYVEAGYAGTVTEVHGCLVDPFLYETLSWFAGYRYTRDHIGSDPTEEYASYFDGDSLWTDNRVVWFGTDQDMGLSSSVAGRLALAPSVANTDIELYFNGTTNQGSLRWMEDEDRFEFGTSGTVLTTEDDGDTYWIGDGAGLLYGSCYGLEMAWSQAAAQNTWYDIVDSDFVDGELNEVAHDGNGKLTVSKAGRYLVSWSLTVKCGTANTYIEAGVEKNDSGTAENAGQAHADSPSANKYISLASSTILDLAASDYLELSIRTTDAGNPTLTVDDAILTVTQIGGT